MVPTNTTKLPPMPRYTAADGNYCQWIIANVPKVRLEREQIAQQSRIERKTDRRIANGGLNV